MTVVRISGIAVRLHYSWLITFGIISWSLSAKYFPQIAPEIKGWESSFVGIATALMMGGSIILHEFGHVAVAMRRGLPVSSITLYVFGGVARFAREPQSAKDEILIAVAGPLVSLVIAAGLSAFNNAVANYLRDFNLMFGAFNLMPVFPLDGGRILRGILWKLNRNYVAAAVTAARVWAFAANGMVVAGIVSAILHIERGVWLVIVGGLMSLTNGAYRKQVKDIHALTITVGEMMVPKEALTVVQQDSTIKDFLCGTYLVHGYHAYPAADKTGTIIGLVLSDDAKKALNGGTLRDESTVADVAQRGYLSKNMRVDIRDSASYAQEVMLLQNVEQLLVFDKETLAGLLTKATLQRAVFISSSRSSNKNSL